MRNWVLLLFGLGAAGAGVDLLLIGHVDGWAQRSPLVLLGCGLAAALWLGAQPRHAAVMLFRATMGAFLVTGAVGLWLHHQANVEFERELAPDRRGAALFWAAIQGASPPSLAPATLIHLGLLGLVSTVRHPSLATATRQTPLLGDES